MVSDLYLLLGSNAGNRNQMICRAVDALVTAVGKVSGKSAIYSSEAWGITHQNDFLNQLIVLKTDEDASTILSICKKIERELGRTKTEKWGSREIDIDILYYGNQIIDEKNLKIPHSALLLRRFALLPLAAIAPNFLHPVVKLSNAQLLQLCTDQGKVTVVK